MKSLVLIETSDMKTLSDKDAELINELIMINNDRINNYTQMIATLDSEADADLISLLEKLGQQSQQFKSQLAPFADQDKDQKASPERLQSKLYSAWTAQQVQPNNEGRESVLQACRKEEKLVESVYTEVLNNIAGIDEKIVEMIKSQLKIQRIARQALDDSLTI